MTFDALADIRSREILIEIDKFFQEFAILWESVCEKVSKTC